MTMAVDANVYQLASEYFDWAQAHPPASRVEKEWERDAPDLRRWATLIDDQRGFGLSATIGPYDYMMTTGGLTVFMWGMPPDLPRMPVINLDLAFDLRDATVAQLRDPVVAALINRNIAFLPVSFNALRNVPLQNDGAAHLELVHRSEMQCVFRVRDVYYISGYDANETPPLYFMARLPGPVDTYAEALESLKPRSVKVAEAQGIRVLRQGDMFAIRTTYRSHDLRAMGATFSTHVDRERPARRGLQFSLRWDAMLNMPMMHSESHTSEPTTETRRRGLYGTAHTARELAYLPDGTMFARGAIMHDPGGVLHESRDPDHGDLTLPGRTWYLVAKNTVPIQGGR